MSEKWYYESTDPNNFIKKIYCYAISYSYYIGKKYHWIIIDKNNFIYELDNKINNINNLYMTNQDKNIMKEAQTNLKILKDNNKLIKRIYNFIKGAKE